MKPVDTGTNQTNTPPPAKTKGNAANITLSQYLNTQTPVKQTQQIVQQYKNNNISQIVNNALYETTKKMQYINITTADSSPTKYANNSSVNYDNSQTTKLVNNAEVQYSNNEPKSVNNSQTKNVGEQTNSGTQYDNNNQTTQHVTKSVAYNNNQTTKYVDTQAIQQDISQLALQIISNASNNIKQYPKAMTETTVQPTYPTTATAGYLTTDPALTTKLTLEKTVASKGASEYVNTNSLPNMTYPESQIPPVQYNDTQQTMIKKNNTVVEPPSGIQSAIQGTTQIETVTTRVAETAATTSKVVNITSNPGKAYQEYSLQSSLPSADANKVDVVSLIEPQVSHNSQNQHDVSHYDNVNVVPPPKANILARLLSKLVGVNATEMDFFRFHNLLHHHPHVETTTTTTPTPPPTTTISVLNYLLRDEVIAKLIQKLKMNNVHTHEGHNHAHIEPAPAGTNQGLPSAISSIIKSAQTVADNVTASDPASILSPNGIMNLYPTLAPAYENIPSAQNVVAPNDTNAASVQNTPYVAGAKASAVTTTVIPTYVNDSTTAAYGNALNANMNSTSAYDTATTAAMYNNVTTAADVYNTTTIANTTFEMTTNVVTTMDPDMVAELAEMAEAEAELLAEAEAEAQAEAEAEAEAAAEAAAV